MGERTIKSSFWSRTSLFSLYGKAVTLLFALFCVATGQTITPAPGNGAMNMNGAAKSRALFASDSTPFGNIKLYLGTVAIPVYGVGFPPHITKIDSTHSDKDGYFEFPGAHYGYNIVAEKVTTSSDSVPRIYVSTMTYNPKAADTLITVYMRPLFFSGTNNRSAGAAAQPLHTVQGKTVTVRIPEWGSEGKTALVMNVKGETVARLQAATGEDIRWNAGSVARGIYFFTIANGKNRFTFKITVP